MTTQSELAKARPTLRQVSPLSHWFVAIMGVFNILLGLTLMFAIDEDRLSASLIIVNDLTSYTFWGFVFICIGVVKLFALKMNNWSLSRKTLILDVSVKAMWVVALVFRIFISPGTVFIILCWLCIAALQMACYIFFMPPNIGSFNQRREDR